MFGVKPSLTSCCQDCTVSDYFAIFEDDVYFTVPHADVARITETLMAHAAKAGVLPDLVWLGCKFTHSHKPNHKILASMKYGGRTLELRQIKMAYATHAFLLRKTCVPSFAQQLELGHSADGALNRATLDLLQVVVTERRKLFAMARQLPPSKTVDERIHDSWFTKP